MSMYDVREEVVNVCLAELLEQRGLLSIPETIRRSVTSKNSRHLPDITIADLLGIRIVIEGRFNTSRASRDSLFNDAKRRVEQGISPVCLACLYPVEIRSTRSLPQLRIRLEKATLEIRVVSENEDGEWSDGSVDDIADALRRSYELLVSDNVVLRSVEEIESAIDTCSDTLVRSAGLVTRFRTVLGIPAELVPEDEEEE